MEENLTRNEVVEQLEETAELESREESYDLPAEPELEGGFDLKSFGIGAAVIGGGALLIKYGPKAVRFVKNHLPKSKKRKVEDNLDEEFDESDYEDADYKEVDEEPSEVEEKQKK